MEIDGLEDALKEVLSSYQREVQESVEKVAKSVAKKGVKALKESSPMKTKGYAEGWAVKKETKILNGSSFIIYNKNKPGLTHLLEKGHVKRNGEFQPGAPHIAPVEAEVKAIFEKEIREIL